MADIEQYGLAALTGLGFGYIITRLGSTPSRLIVILVALWTLQTGSQFIYRALDGVDVTDELIIVTGLRVTFTAFAVLVVWALDRRTT